jgi:hypothetical protein
MSAVRDVLVPLYGQDQQLTGVRAATVVRAGPAGALWRVEGEPRTAGDGRLLLRLVAVEPHDVPLDVAPVVLPDPLELVRG